MRDRNIEICAGDIEVEIGGHRPAGIRGAKARGVVARYAVYPEAVDDGGTALELRILLEGAPCRCTEYTSPKAVRGQCTSHRLSARTTSSKCAGLEFAD